MIKAIALLICLSLATYILEILCAIFRWILTIVRGEPVELYPIRHAVITATIPFYIAWITGIIYAIWLMYDDIASNILG